MLFLGPFALAPVAMGFSVAMLSLAEPSLLTFETAAALPLGLGLSSRGLVEASEEAGDAGIGLTTGLPLLSWLNLLIKSSAAAAARGGGFLPVLGFAILTIAYRVRK